jgi:hypothetical protein
VFVNLRPRFIFLNFSLVSSETGTPFLAGGGAKASFKIFKPLFSSANGRYKFKYFCSNSIAFSDSHISKIT